MAAEPRAAAPAILMEKWAMKNEKKVVCRMLHNSLLLPLDSIPVQFFSVKIFARLMHKYKTKLLNNTF